LALLHDGAILAQDVDVVGDSGAAATDGALRHRSRQQLGAAVLLACWHGRSTSTRCFRVQTQRRADVGEDTPDQPSRGDHSAQSLCEQRSNLRRLAPVTLGGTPPLLFQRPLHVAQRCFGEHANLESFNNHGTGGERFE